ncbi:MAG: hypothetical protein IT299_02010 [Dehalococcoidia bacterium]|nr:hypothetical protein [Dehalococcoidia bacterium]
MRWIAFAMLAAVLAGCARDAPPPPTSLPTSAPVTATRTVVGTPTATTSATASASPPSPSPTSRPGAALPAPTNVRLTGRLPDTSATVPPGEGEAGRVTVHWDGVPNAAGYRIYERSCDGAVRVALDVGREDRQYGPLQPCRPGGDVGVSAVLPGGESAITWARATP